MRTLFKYATLPTGLAIGLCLLLSSRVKAQNFTTLHQFSPTFSNSSENLTNGDGTGTIAGLLLVGNRLFGAALIGGTNSTGTVFSLGTNGAGFTTLHNFAFVNFGGPNSGGGRPAEALTLVGTNLFGTAQFGGTNGNGTIFTLGTNGAGFKDLHSFSSSLASVAQGGKETNSDGTGPEYGPLLFSSNVLYGTAAAGGTNGNGTLFAINTNGSGFTVLHTFAISATNTSLSRVTNSDGISPNPGLVLSGATLYGVAFSGGTNGWGTIFTMDTNGIVFTTLHHFARAVANGSAIYTNSEGTSPLCRLILSGDTLYGTTAQGGTNGSGTVFAINTNGTGFTTLHHFSALNSNTNSDGSFPASGLISSGNTLYGTTRLGGANGEGAVYALNTAGNIFTNLHSFSAIGSDGAHNFINTNSDGANPFAPLVLSGNLLYGTTPQGGTNANGTVYSVFAPSLAATVFNPPQLTLRYSGTNVIVTWPTNLTGLTLQSATNLGSTAVWITAVPAPVVVNTNNTVTNSAAGTWKFYRLN